MDEQQLREMASQLRKPEGEAGMKIGEWMNKGNLQINTDTLNVLNSVGEDSILEIGMGNGFFVNEILKEKPFVTYTGCDFSEVMIEEAEKINREWIVKGQAKFLNADVKSLPFKSEVFNKIFTINTLYFWDDETTILRELKRVLSENGQLIITIRPKHQMIKYPFTKYGFRMYSKNEVINLLVVNGFAVKETFENLEPDFELNGEVMKMENLIIVAAKIK